MTFRDFCRIFENFRVPLGIPLGVIFNICLTFFLGLKIDDFWGTFYNRNGGSPDLAGG
jgi:hypothetical protein